MLRLVSFLALNGLIALVACLPYEIETKDGPVVGYTEEGVSIWRGIPFAAPPVGPFRFAAPQPVVPWTFPRPDWWTPHICPQIRSIDGIVLGNEDCLYLDIYVPENATADSKLPVMVWFFGGGYVLGDGFEFGFYDGINVVRKHNVIVVTPNYRLSALGFMALDGLKAEDPNKSTGNYALQDQVAVLKWVQANAAAFGGDPSAVTIFGESAGAFSVCWHLASQSSAGLFRAAIMESGQCQVPSFFVDYPNAQSWSLTYAKKVGCPAGPNVTQCLRDLPVAQLLSGSLLDRSHFSAEDDYLPKLFPVMPWGPAIDGSSAGLTDYPLSHIQKGTWNKVPVLAGTNNNEGTLFMPMMAVVVPGTTFPLTDAGMHKMLLHFFNDTTATAIRGLYPSTNYATQDARGAAILRDFFFACSTRRVLGTIQKQNYSSYLYHFTYDPGWIEDPVLGEYHSAELYFVWDNAWPPLVHEFTAADKAMAASIGKYWTNLAKSGSPNFPVEPTTLWPLYQEGTNAQDIILDVPVVVESNYVGGVCPFWDTLDPRAGDGQ